MTNESGDSYSFSNSFQIQIPSFQVPKIEFPNARQVRDFAVTTVSVGALVGGAAFGCAVVMNPVTVAMVGLPFYAAEITGVVATGSSSYTAKFVGEKLVRYGYKAAGQDLDEGAFNVAQGLPAARSGPPVRQKPFAAVNHYGTPRNRPPMRTMRRKSSRLRALKSART